MVKVEKDLVAEKYGVESMVGQMVEVVKKIPKGGYLTAAAPGMGSPGTDPVLRDVYLVVAPKSRLFRGLVRCSPVIMMYKAYAGNDVYSAEELGL